MRSNSKSTTGAIQPTFDMGAETPASASPLSLEDMKRIKKREYMREYEKRHKDDIRTKANRRFNERYANDPVFREAYKERKREAGRRRSARNRETTKAWRLRNLEHRENYRLQYEYGITLAQYFEILEAQGGVCMLCLKPPTERKLAVDHDHETGEVRGLMHRTCNSSFRGIFGDDPKALHRAFLRFGYMADVIRAPGSYIPGGLAAVR
jgi:hypothetical protein